ncbi:MAG: hypothetical protein KatS3mg055_0446 [Chloroflexus sp.]|uniref:transposase n=1 Tax=Chloroflexus sp. TaxID=1904827 RepID=UPI0021DDF585|nr:transposase [Chloroflexus sp.]GIV87928.1 MAG: hypothetical protein KatS3mg055_0446 [Chloroflexus sp.]
MVVDRLKTRLEELIRETVPELGCEMVALEMMPDQLHLVVSATPQWVPNHIVERFKGKTSRIVRQEFPCLRRMPSWGLVRMSGQRLDTFPRILSGGLAKRSAHADEDVCLQVASDACQVACLSETVETCRQRYNHALSERKTAYRERGESIGFARQCASLPMLKREVPHLQRVHSQVLQDVVRRVDRAFQAFFRRVNAGEKAGYPRCKGQGRYDSFTYPQWGNGVKLERDGSSSPKSALSGCTTIA